MFDLVLSNFIMKQVTFILNLILMCFHFVIFLKVLLLLC
jgi:hypothetical protein